MMTKFAGVVFSGLGLAVSMLPQRYVLQNTPTTIMYFNQTVDVFTAPTSGATPIDFPIFAASLCVAILCAASLLITAMEDSV